MVDTLNQHYAKYPVAVGMADGALSDQFYLQH
jgi:hypothetical protein